MCDSYNLPQREDPPYVPLMPASLEIKTQKINAGWWKWNISINEELYEDHEIVPWKVNEEGRITVFKVWTLSCKLLQLEIEARSAQVDYHYDLVVDRDAFISLLMKTYCDFGKQGGWGWYGDRVYEEDWNMEPERIILDCGKFKQYFP